MSCLFMPSVHNLDVVQIQALESEISFTDSSNLIRSYPFLCARVCFKAEV